MSCGCASLAARWCVQVLSVVGILQDEVDPMVSVMKVEKAPLESYADVGGLEQQIQEIKEAVELPLTHPEALRGHRNQAPQGCHPLWRTRHRQDPARQGAAFSLALFFHACGLTLAGMGMCRLLTGAPVTLHLWCCPCSTTSMSLNNVHLALAFLSEVPCPYCPTRAFVRVVLCGCPQAVANSTSATFLRVVGSELIQKYLGDGPKLVRELFRVADELSPSIVFIDEIDAVGTKRYCCHLPLEHHHRGSDCHCCSIWNAFFWPHAH